VITEGGSDVGGYVVYEGVPGSNTISLNPGSGHCVIVNASFVVVRNFVLQGCGMDGVHVNASDVIIEDNDVSGWGHQATQQDNLRDAGVGCEQTSPPGLPDNQRVHRIVIQRNKFHSPRFQGIPWQTSAGVVPHSQGAQAVTFSVCGHNH